MFRNRAWGCDISNAKFFAYHILVRKTTDHVTLLWRYTSTSRSKTTADSVNEIGRRRITWSWSEFRHVPKRRISIHIILNSLAHIQIHDTNERAHTSRKSQNESTSLAHTRTYELQINQSITWTKTPVPLKNVTQKTYNQINERANDQTIKQHFFFQFSFGLDVFVQADKLLVFDDIFSSSSSPFPRTFVTTSVCPVILDTLSFLKYRKSIENHLHDPLLPRRSVLLFDHQTTLISYLFRNIWYLLPCSGKISTFSYTCAVHRSQHLPCQSDQIRGSIRTLIGTIIFWMLCSYVRPWKYKWGTSFSFVISWVWKNHCRTCQNVFLYWLSR